MNIQDTIIYDELLTYEDANIAFHRRVKIVQIKIVIFENKFPKSSKVSGESLVFNVK